MTHLTLHDGWTLSVASGTEHVPDPLRARLTEGIPAAVPGCVHTDLMAAGLIPDPYVGFNEREQAWVGEVAWRYTLRFEAPASVVEAGRVDLACDGLDTLAEVTLNGQAIGRSANMHARQRFDAGDALQVGANELVITFASPLEHIRRMHAHTGELPFQGHGSNPPQPHNTIRKMACNFGWDWGPQLVTAGVWKPVRLEAWGGGRLTGLRPQVTHADSDRATVELVADAEREGDAPLSLRYELTDPDGQAVGGGTVMLEPGQAVARAAIDIDRPRRWWPSGYGDQPLYTLRATLTDDAGHTLGSASRRVGLRTIELVTTSDEAGPGSAFHLAINGKRVFCKGANWIPDDCFPHRVTPRRYRERLTQARDAHMNMLRVWGGGLYEADAFYDACDELGILVWQDFLTACSAYPEVEPYPALFEQEARDNIARIAGHPSLALWNGGNECIWAAFAWGERWNALRTQREIGWGLAYWLGLFPKLLAELDPATPYWPNSPYSGDMDTHANAEHAGNCHHWDVWNGHGDYHNYWSHTPRFASEFGFHGPPTWPTLDRAIGPDQRAWDSQGMHHHNRQAGGQERADRLIHTYYHRSDDFDDWLYLAQLNQARALTLGCEWFRSLSPHTSGALYWQLNDCWPVASWSAIDGDGRPKPLWYATRRFYAPRLVTIQPAAPVASEDEVGELAVCFHNDHDEPWAGRCGVRLLDLDGAVLGEAAHDVAVDPRGSHRFAVPESLRDGGGALLLAEMGGVRSFYWFEHDKEIDYPEPAFDARAERTGDTIALTITARTLLRDLIVYPDRLDPAASIDDQLVTLLPGESHTFTIRTDADLSVEALTTRPVMQVANLYGRGAGGAGGKPQRGGAAARA